MEHCTGHVVEMTSTRINFPCLRFAHPPYFDDAIICGRDDERESGVEDGVVHAAVVTFEDVLDGRKSVERLEIPGTSVG